MRKLLVVLMCMTILLCGSVYAADFSDLPTEHWAYKNVMNLVEQNVINGYPDGTYKPNGQVTRAEFFKLISVAALGEEYFKPYQEMFEGYWQLPYASWIYSQKLMMSATSMNDLDAPITRLEMGVVLSKIVDYLNIKRVYSEDDVKIEFTDISDLKYGNQLYIESIADYGLIKGYEDSTYRPNAYMNRAEVATVIYRFLEINEGRGM